MDPSGASCQYPRSRRYGSKRCLFFLPATAIRPELEGKPGFGDDALLAQKFEKVRRFPARTAAVPTTSARIGFPEKT